MILSKTILLFVLGLAGGLIVSAGIYAFITLLQIIQRLSSRTDTAKHVLFYEDCVMAGGILGNFIDIYQISIPIGMVGLAMYGVFSGMFVGCLAIALAEIIDVIPAFGRRIKLKVGIPYLVLCIALGKALGVLYQLVINP